MWLRKPYACWDCPACEALPHFHVRSAGAHTKIHAAMRRELVLYGSNTSLSNATHPGVSIAIVPCFARSCNVLIICDACFVHNFAKSCCKCCESVDGSVLPVGASKPQALQRARNLRFTDAGSISLGPSPSAKPLAAGPIRYLRASSTSCSTRRAQPFRLSTVMYSSQEW